MEGAWGDSEYSVRFCVNVVMLVGGLEADCRERCGKCGLVRGEWGVDIMC